AEPVQPLPPPVVISPTSPGYTPITPPVVEYPAIAPKSPRPHGVVKTTPAPGKPVKSKTTAVPPATPSDRPTATPIVEQRPSVQPIPSAPPFGGATFSLAEPVSVSISSELRKHLPPDTLLADVRTALSGLQIRADIQRPFTSNYVPPGDEEFSMAEAGNQA